MLPLVVQVDAYLYAGSPQLESGIEEFLHEQLQIGSMRYTYFTIMGAHISQDNTGKKMINAKEKLDQIQQFVTSQSAKGYNRTVTEKEVTEYRSVVGKLLSIERLFGPTIAFHESQAAAKCSDTLLHQSTSPQRSLTRN